MYSNTEENQGEIKKIIPDSIIEEVKDGEVEEHLVSQKAHIVFLEKLVSSGFEIYPAMKRF